MSEHLAAIDIGTNSIHLVVAKAHANPRFEVVAQEKETVRLGSGSRDMKYLQVPAMERAIRALVRFRQIAELSQAKIRAVATSAVREALNQSAFLERVRQEAGLEVDVISGFEEARLIYLGVMQALPWYERKTLLVDIGGGSTEFLIGRRGEALAANSLKLGAIRLTDHFFQEDPLNPKALARCRQHVQAFLDPLVREFRSLGFESAAGSSGSIQNLAQMVKVLRGEEPAFFLNNFTFRRTELDEVVRLLVKADTLKKRQKLEGLDPNRADIILGGAILLEQILAAFQIEQLTVSGYALREGVIFDMMNQSQPDGLHHLSDIRYKGVVHLGKVCHYQEEHARHVANLAMQLFDQLSELHQLPEATREYLEAASLLHDIGFFISHAQHHRHSYYLIRNSEYLTGFSSREIEIIAQVARYHRKSVPKPKHPEFSRLDFADQHLVRMLAAILRVADSLDRTHKSAVQQVRCQTESAALNIHLETRDGEPPPLEIYTAESRRILLEEMLGRKIFLQFEPPSPILSQTALSSRVIPMKAGIQLRANPAGTTQG
jgi:exopolyphosphatase/guanosine-5'-triphosphate,3'-diphosphate pyrophosphatase